MEQISMLYRTCALTLAGLLISSYSFSFEPILRIAGSNTVGAKLGPACAAGFLKDKLGASDVEIIQTGKENEFSVVSDNHQINFEAHGSSTGFKALFYKKANIAMASRPIKSTEHEKLALLGDMRSSKAEHTIAIDGLAIIVNQNNTVNSLNKNQIAKIFSGEITNWADVGGNSQAINIYARDNNSGTWDTFKSLVLGKIPLSHKALRFESNNTLAVNVSSDRAGIGFTSLASVGVNKALAIADNNTAYLKPNHLTVASEDYLLSRRLFMYSRPFPQNKYVKPFIEYCLSSQGQERVKSVGFVSQNIETVTQTVNPNTPVDYQQLAKEAERLSVNFRFNKTSAELDNKAKDDIQRLVDFYQLQTEQIEITLVGFSNTKRSPSVAKIISKMRAQAVKTALQEEGIKVKNLLALGDNISVVANNSKESSVKNGRVEVWVKKSNTNT